MTISRHKEEFGGKRVVEWKADEKFDPATNAARITVEYDADDEEWVKQLEAFLALPNAQRTTAFIVGNWGEASSGTSCQAVIDALVENGSKMPLLEAFFIGDLVCEESEISWIIQGDVGPLLAAFPRLREFGVRGGSGLAFGKVQHGMLQKLVVETGGLDGSVVRQILASKLPGLTHLELWLGTDEYGATTTIDDLQPLLSGSVFPQLKYLGLRNSDIADEIAVAVADAPILDRIDILDLSMGTLGDVGGEALANSAAILKLKKLDIHHHYVSDEVLEILKSKCLSIDASEQEDGGENEEDRYVSIGE